jgi:hypothetical protein
MKLVSIFLIFSIFMISCTSNKPEDRVALALEKSFGKEELKKEMEIGLTKLLGKEETKFKRSLYDYFIKTIKLNYSDIKVEGTKATAKISVVRPNEEDFAGLFLMVSVVDRKKLNDMTLEQFLAELSKGQRKIASVNDFRTDTFESNIELNQVGEEWKVDQKTIKNFFSKKNRVKAKK